MVKSRIRTVGATNTFETYFHFLFLFSAFSLPSFAFAQRCNVRHVMPAVPGV
jgi:hypothetical protein